jgi:threonine dehydrogenase-like Zn-dependent dehydrogenase
VRSLTFVAAGKLEWRESAEPVMQGPGEALVRPLAVATCDLDGAIVAGSSPFPGPFALGHEFVAEVVETGDEVGSVRTGDRVIVPFQISCGTCAPCREGRTGNCASVQFTSMYGLGAVAGDWGGALSDLVRVPYADPMLVAVPEGIEPANIASVSDNVADGWRTVAGPLAERPAAPVLVVGGALASISLYATQAAVALGAERVDFVDHDSERLALAEALGAHPVEAPPNGQDGPYDAAFPERMGPYPITVDASAHPAGLGCALRSTEPDGTCTSAGIYWAPTTPVPLFEMYTKGITFHTGRVHSRAVLPKVLELISDGRIRPEQVTSAVVPWDEAAEALATPRTKLVVTRA